MLYGTVTEFCTASEVRISLDRKHITSFILIHIHSVQSCLLVHGSSVILFQPYGPQPLFQLRISLGGRREIQTANETPRTRICWCIDEVVTKPSRWWEYVSKQDWWVTNLFDSERHLIFLSGMPFPKNFRDTVKTIVRRLFRVYAHIYSNHFDHICALGIEGVFRNIWMNNNTWLCAFYSSSEYQLQTLLPLY